MVEFSIIEGGREMPLDPQQKVVLEAMAALGNPPNHTLPAAEARANAARRPLTPGPEVAHVEDRMIPGPGGDLPVRIFTPAGEGLFPVLMYFHGGGWVLGSVEASDGTCRWLANGAECIVVSVEYRLAPESKFPAAADDCYAATVWAAENAGSFRGDGVRLAVTGGSAGGNLAAVVSLMARDRGGPRIAQQTLVYPVIERDFSTASYQENAVGYGLERKGMEWYWDHYLRDDRDALDPYAAPIQAESLAGLPPALVITAEFDPLRDEGEKYAAALSAAGVPTMCTRYDGVAHLFYGLPERIDKGAAAIKETTLALRTAFAPG